MAPAKRSSGRKPRQTKTKRKLCQLQPRSMMTGHSNSEEVKVGGRTQKQREERPANDARHLDAVNGIVSVSKIRPGQGLIQGAWDPHDTKLVHPCSICGRRFERRNHVKVHMAPCVKRNGNPNGVRWDNAWKKTISAQVDDEDNDDDAENNQSNNHDEDEEAARVSEEGDSESQTEERDLPEIPPSTPLGDYSITGNSPADLSSASSSASTPSSLSPSSPNLRRRPTPPTPAPQPQSNGAVGTFGAYDPTFPADRLTNETLVGIVYHLDYLNYHQHVGQANVRPYPQLENVMQELALRGIAREQRSWTLDLEGGAIEFNMAERGRPGS